MPVRQVGKDCYQWGNQKKYCGPGAKQKAILQGIAIENTGWKEAEYQPNQTLEDYDDEGLTHSSAIDGYQPFKYSVMTSRAETFESKPYRVVISRSTKDAKKLMAVFYDGEDKKIKTTHFGARGASDYTKHGDKERMERYLERHGGGFETSTKENWKDPTTAGALSRWILWNKPSLSSSFADYKRRFGLQGTMTVSKSAEDNEKFGASSSGSSSPITRRGYWRKESMVPIFCGMLFAAFTFRNR